MTNDATERDARRDGLTAVRRATRTVAVVAAAGTALAAGAIGLHARADSAGGTAATTGSSDTQSAVPQQTQDQSQGGFGSNAPSQGFGPPAGRSGGS